MPDLVELVRRGEEAFNAHDPEAMAGLYAEAATMSAPGPMTVSGRDAVIAWLAGWWRGFPDARIEIHERHVAGDIAFTRGTFHGTHTGDFPTPMGDLPPTGRSVTGDYLEIFHFDASGLIEAEHLMFDRLGLLEDLGVIPAPATATA